MKVHIQRKNGGIRQQPIGSVSLSASPEFIPFICAKYPLLAKEIKKIV
jgi:hypothetical protein